MKQAYLYCDPKSLNDATNYYVALMTKPLISKGNQVKIVHNLSEIKSPNVIITITEKYFFFAKLRFPFTKTIYWAQGIGAEEAKMGMKTPKQYLRYLFRRIIEPLAVNLSDLLFCVSERMVVFFKEKFHLKDNGQIIVMPCYNLPLSDYFYLNQYNTPTFVYAGGASIWQGVDLMLDVYKAVEKELPNSKLILLTKDESVFIEKIKEREIQNYEIKYVAVSELQKELHKYKYGFILRDNNIVNQVATPTKMNSYLSNYVIPIFSDTVDDFNKNINLGEFTLKATFPLNPQKIAAQILKFEKNRHNYNALKHYTDKVFLSHYNDNVYLTEIEQKIINLV